MRSRSAAVRLGHEQGKIRDVLISDLVITDSNRGFAIFSRTGGFVENVRIHDVILHTRIVAGAWWGKGEAVVICAAGSEGRIRNIDIRNLSARCEGGILLAGSEGNVENITLKDISLAVKEGPNYALYGGDLDLRPNLYIPGAADPGCPVYVSGVEGLVRENITTITD